MASGQAIRMDIVHLEEKKAALKAAIKFFMIYSVKAHKSGQYRKAAEKLERARESMKKLKELDP